MNDKPDVSAAERCVCGSTRQEHPRYGDHPFAIAKPPASAARRWWKRLCCWLRGHEFQPLNVEAMRGEAMRGLTFEQVVGRATCSRCGLRFMEYSR